VTRPSKTRKTESAAQSISAVIARPPAEGPVDNICQEGCQGHPKQLIPIEKRKAEELRHRPIIEGDPSHDGERDEKK
jgi:hypothetical protein